MSTMMMERNPLRIEGRELSPEKKLLWAMFVRALLDYIGDCSRDDVKAWFADDVDTYGSSLFICLALGIDPSHRLALLKAPKEAISLLRLA